PAEDGAYVTFRDYAQVLQARRVVAEGDVGAILGREVERFRNPPLEKRPLAALDRWIPGRFPNRAARGGVGVVVNNQRAILTAPVGVGVHVLVDPAAFGDKVVENEVPDLGELSAAAQQRKNLALVASDQT